MNNEEEKKQINTHENDEDDASLTRSKNIQKKRDFSFQRPTKAID